MKVFEFQSIGHYKETSSNTAEIVIKEEFKKALTRLDNFSHCLLFSRNENEIFCFSARIVHINEKKGEMAVEYQIKSGMNLKGDLVDIKPYFPCEEIVLSYNDTDKIKQNKENFKTIPFKGNSIGEYLFADNMGMIQLRESKDMTGRDIEALLDKISNGDYIRILWWFHRFDGKRYRSCTMCNPPYENAPKCGIFATRSPVRPNPLASTIVKVISADKFNHIIYVAGFDGFEHSSVLQIMPYDAVEVFKDVKVPKWVEHWTDYKVFESSEESCVDTEKTEIKNKRYDGVFAKELESEEDTEYDYAALNEIVVEHANIHNLKDISVKIPKEKITVITGVSGSGKSSIAFDTIYHESQRQFFDLVSSNSPYDGDFKDSCVGKISGLQPSIAIEQRSLGFNPRSTVATVTRAGDYLRLLFSVIGERVCPNCGMPVQDNNVCSKCGAIFFKMTPSIFNCNNPEYMCPVCKGLGMELQIDTDLIIANPNISILDGASIWWGNLRKFKEKPNANWMKGEVLALADDMKENLELPFKELSDEFKKQLFYGSNGREVTFNYENSNGRKGTIKRPAEGAVNILKRLLRENSTDSKVSHLERFIVNKKCSCCNGEKLSKEGRNVRIGDLNYPGAASMSIAKLINWCHYIYSQLNDSDKGKSKIIFIKLIKNLKKLEQAGLGYISPDRSVPTLSGGEAQRLKIAAQFGSGLSNILYIMDEPSKGLHPKDYKFLIKSIEDLKRLRNTVIMVEHKESFISSSDYMIEIGPGAGAYGGQLIRAEEVKNFASKYTEDYDFKVSDNIITGGKKILLKGAGTNNLKNIDFSLPLNKLICVIGVSGSGKSSLIAETLYPAIVKELGKGEETLGKYDSITGTDYIKAAHYVSQAPIGRSSRSNPGTYTGVFDLIRDFYSALEDAKNKEFSKEHFSFNSPKGQCEECKGAGEISIPMHFMPDITMPCAKCGGKRYTEDVLSVKYKGYSVSDILELEIGRIKELFINDPKIYDILNMLDKVGLSYLKLGQSSTTLSGGEAQRIKLAKELCDSRTKDVIYILDEPSNGLHASDVQRLNYIFSELVGKGSTVVVIEHNPLIIQNADYIIEMGPEGGELGGYIIKEGWLKK